MVFPTWSESLRKFLADYKEQLDKIDKHYINLE
jgi:intein-encoded DNA endonuclease-like protein